ncbi:MAG: helix-turn-helix domain-containing protein, partial [Candidatus Eiseniibacteriota bacterium]
AEDIVPLARHFLAFYAGIEGPRLSGDAEAVLRSHSWPGNVRELENLMRRVGALHGGEAALTAASLLPFLGATSAPPTREDDRQAILAAHEACGGNKSRMAEQLGVSRKTLYARLKRLGLELD